MGLKSTSVRLCVRPSFCSHFQISCEHSSSSIFNWIFFNLAGNEYNQIILKGYGFSKIQQRTAELAALERL